MNRPHIHMTALRNWINDPNGFIYYKEEYHLFYQYFPYDTQWGTMHWGHVTSKDLLHFTHHPIALYPSKEFDKNGCFSGTALIKDDELYLYYTGVKYLKTNEENIHKPEGDDGFEACQALIVSKDGYTFDNIHDKCRVVAPIEDLTLGHKTHTRDPKVWKYKDTYIMALGSKFKKTGAEDFVGEVLFYTSKDGKNWAYKNRSYNEKIGNMWECPDIFDVDGRHMFIMSPEQIMYDDKNYPSHAVYTLVEFDEETCTMHVPDTYQYIDLGLDIYAPQTTVDKDGNRILIGWMRMPKAFEHEEWIGMMTLPRVIHIQDENVMFSIPEYINNEFKKEISCDEFTLDKPVRMQASLTAQGSINIGGYKLYVEDDKLIADRSDVFVDCDIKAVHFETPKLHGQYDIDAYIDNGIIEVFVNKGKYVITNVVYGLQPIISYEHVENISLVEMNA